MTLTRTLAAAAATTLAFALGACTASSPTGDNAAPKTSHEATSALTITDVKGRTVTLDEQPERIILGEGRGLFATSLLNKDNPVDHVVALGSDLSSGAPSFEKALTEAVPAVADVPTIGSLSKGDVSVENLLTFDPDVLVMSADHFDALSTNGMLDKLDQAHIPYVVTDFRQHPLTNTTTSMTVYGQLLGKEATAARFNDEWTATVERVKERTNTLDPASLPTTFLWRAAGLKDCCATVANANLGELVTAAGGRNIAEAVLDSNFGDLTNEKVITSDPDVIIATGGSWDPAKSGSKKDEKKGGDATKQAVPHAELGYFTDADVASATLAGLLQTTGFDQLSAPKQHRFYGVWHQFYDSPLNFLALEQFAAWLHPELFSDVDVNAHWVKIHEDYLPIAATGTFFTEMEK